MTNSIKNYIEKNIKIDDICERITDYLHCDSQYIDDILTEIADSATDIYYSDLIDWLKNDPDSTDYIEESVQEFGTPDSKDFDFMKLLQQGQYYQNEQKLYQNKYDMCLLWALSYCIENNIKLTDEQIDKLSDIIDNHTEKFADIIAKIDEIKNND